MRRNVIILWGIFLILGGILAPLSHAKTKPFRILGHPSTNNPPASFEKRLKARTIDRSNDPLSFEQWHLKHIGTYEAWEISQGADQVIAVIDSGVNYLHPDLKGKVIHGRDFVDRDNDPMDLNGHGTHVAGIIAAHANNNIGGAGVAPLSQILAIRVLDKNGSGTVKDVADGIIYAANKNVDIINLSLGSPWPEKPVEDAIKYAASKGILITCAAGNSDIGVLDYPAKYDQCLSVSATDYNQARAMFSSYGPGLDLAAPGDMILSTVLGNKYDSYDGTSMAAPITSGILALSKSAGLDSLSNAKQSSHDLLDVGYDLETGAGEVDAKRALTDVNLLPLTNSIPHCVRAALHVYQGEIANIPAFCGDAFDTKVQMKLSTAALNGRVWFSKGRLMYQANKKFVGRDTFSVFATNEIGQSSTSLISVITRPHPKMLFQQTMKNEAVRQCGKTIHKPCPYDKTQTGYFESYFIPGDNYYVYNETVSLTIEKQTKHGFKRVRVKHSDGFGEVGDLPDTFLTMSIYSPYKMKNLPKGLYRVRMSGKFEINNIQIVTFDSGYSFFKRV